MKQVLSNNFAVVQSSEVTIVKHPSTIFADDSVQIDTFETEEDLNYFIARKSPDSYPPLPQIGELVKEGYYQYGDLIVECIQSHTRMNYTVEETPALFNIIQPISEGYPVWVQPTGSHDAYGINDIVHYPGEGDQLWISKIDANTTVPDGDVPYNRYWEPYNE